MRTSISTGVPRADIDMCHMFLAKSAREVNRSGLKNQACAAILDSDIRYQRIMRYWMHVSIAGNMSMYHGEDYAGVQASIWNDTHSVHLSFGTTIEHLIRRLSYLQSRSISSLYFMGDRHRASLLCT